MSVGHDHHVAGGVGKDVEDDEIVLAAIHDERLAIIGVALYAIPIFGIILVLMMLFRPAGILPSALRKRELETPKAGA